MKIIDKNTKEVIAEITTNRSMTIEEACNLMKIKIAKTQEDFENENGYDINDLEMEY